MFIALTGEKVKTLFWKENYFFCIIAPLKFEMNTQERNRQDKGYVRFRTIFNIAMGLLYIACGILVVMAKKLGFRFSVPISGAFVFSLGGLFILYGLFRIYRGIKRIF